MSGAKGIRTRLKYPPHRAEGVTMPPVIKTIVVSALLLTLQYFSAAAGPLEEADAALDKGDHQTAFRIYKSLAEQGDAIAQIKLGGIYADGKGVERDYSAALDWFRRAADQGNARAQFNLGTMYEHGQGTSQDYNEAAKWYRLAVAQDHAGAQFNLGTLYAEG